MSQMLQKLQDSILYVITMAVIASAGITYAVVDNLLMKSQRLDLERERNTVIELKSKSRQAAQEHEVELSQLKAQIEQISAERERLSEMVKASTSSSASSCQAEKKQLIDELQRAKEEIADIREKRNNCKVNENLSQPKNSVGKDDISTPNQRTKVSQELEYTLHQCKKEKRYVRCCFLVTSQKKDIHLTLIDKNQEMWDDLGKKYTALYTTIAGLRQEDYPFTIESMFPQGIPVNSCIVFSNIKGKPKTVRLLKMQFDGLAPVKYYDVSISSVEE
jgi:chromosome segregation ATPase